MYLLAFSLFSIILLFFVSATTTATMDQIEQRSPGTGRYCRFKELLGAGAFKKVYKGVDTELGIEIAWATIDLDRAGVDVKQLKKVSVLFFCVSCCAC